MVFIYILDMYGPANKTPFSRSFFGKDCFTVLWIFFFWTIVLTSCGFLGE